MSDLMVFPICVEAGDQPLEDWPCEFDVEREVGLAEPYSWGVGRGEEAFTSAEFYRGYLGDLEINRTQLIEMIGLDAVIKTEREVAIQAGEKLAEAA